MIATKYTVVTNPNDPNSSGNQRKNLMRSLEASLKRLNTDYKARWFHDFACAVLVGACNAIALGVFYKTDYLPPQCAPTSAKLTQPKPISLQCDTTEFITSTNAAISVLKKAFQMR